MPRPPVVGQLQPQRVPRVPPRGCAGGWPPWQTRFGKLRGWCCAAVQPSRRDQPHSRRPTAHQMRCDTLVCQLLRGDRCWASHEHAETRLTQLQPRRFVLDLVGFM